MDATVIYYTANREDAVFESRILEHLMQSIGDLPIITVSHKPMDIGENICVGDVGVSNINIFRQLQIGAESAKTDYIVTAESDYLHPPDYFRFEPESKETIYTAVPLYVFFPRHKSFYPKDHGSEGAMIIGREYLLKRLDKMLEGQPQWMDYPGKDYPIPHLLHMGKVKMFNLSYPMVTFRTANQLHRRTPFVHEKCRELPYWGKASNLIEKYIGNNVN